MGDLFRDPNKIPGKQGCSVVVDLHELNEVLDLRVTYADKWPTLDLLVRCVSGRVVEVKLTGVRKLTFDGIVPRLWLNAIEIEDERDAQLEGVSFRVFSRRDRALDCLCDDFQVIEAT